MSEVVVDNPVENFSKVFFYELVGPNYTERKIICGRNYDGSPTVPPGTKVVGVDGMRVVGDGANKRWVFKYREYRTSHVVEYSDPCLLITTAALVYADQYLFNESDKTRKRFPTTHLSWTTLGDMNVLEVTLINPEAEAALKADPNYARLRILEKGRSNSRIFIKNLVCENGMVIEDPDMISLARLIGTNKPRPCSVHPQGEDLLFRVHHGDYVERERQYREGLPVEPTPSEIRAEMQRKEALRYEFEARRRAEMKKLLGPLSNMDNLLQKYTDEALSRITRDGLIE